MIAIPTESEVKHCPTCGMGICPGPDATPEQRAAAVQEQSREWACKDIPQDEWDKWVREFVAAQIRCACEPLENLREIAGMNCEGLPYEVREALHKVPGIDKTHRCAMSDGR